MIGDTFNPSTGCAYSGHGFDRVDRSDELTLLTRGMATMLALLGLVLLIWIACVLVGVFVKGLFWLIIVGVVLFVATSVVGFVKREALGRR